MALWRIIDDRDILHYTSVTLRKYLNKFLYLHALSSTMSAKSHVMNKYNSHEFCMVRCFALPEAFYQYRKSQLCIWLFHFLMHLYYFTAIFNGDYRIIATNNDTYYIFKTCAEYFGDDGKWTSMWILFLRRFMMVMFFKNYGRICNTVYHLLKFLENVFESILLWLQRKDLL